MDRLKLWTRYQEWLYYHEGLDLSVDVSRMRFADAYAAAMDADFAAAFDAMAALERGEIANPDEQRMVGHYWLRDPDLAPSPAIRDEIVATLEAVESFADRVRAGAITLPVGGGFTDLLVIGIGGSALGPQLVSDALAPEPPPLAVHFIDNTDPQGIDRTIARLKGRITRTLVVVTSKSGTTPETCNGMIEVRHVFGRHDLPFPRHAVAVTTRGSLLDELARSEGWLATFPMFDWVGGRTSLMSAVGLLPAALLGIDIRAMLTGAREMDRATRARDVRRNPAALLALAWHFAGGGCGRKDMVVLPYKDSLLLLGRYLQQLVMESLGKEKDLDGRIVRQGLTVYGNKGSTDQHAYVQQLREGVDNAFVTFIEVLRDRTGPAIDVEPGVTSGDYLSGFLHGTRRALYENGRDSVMVTIPGVTPLSLGALIALFERAVGLFASLVHINAYHQPGVEAGKKAAASILALQARVLSALRSTKGPMTLEYLAAEVGAPDEVETIHAIVRHLDANGRGVVLVGDRARPARLLVTSA